MCVGKPRKEMISLSYGFIERMNYICLSIVESFYLVFQVSSCISRGCGLEECVVDAGVCMSLCN